MYYVMILFLIFVQFTYANIINIPDDFETIQAGIDEAEEGDTVLVAPGTYHETLTIEGRRHEENLTIASHMLTTGLSGYIDSTVIDGDGESSVVRFERWDRDDCIFNGFTLINGSGSRDQSGDNAGGGIHCVYSSPVLTNLIIKDNSAEFGGGVFLQDSSPSVSYCRIVDNEAEVTGGGIFCSRNGTEPLISYTLIARNDAGDRADGFGAYGFSAPRLQNVTIVDNDEFGIFLTDDSDLLIINSIIWNNDIGAQWGDNAIRLRYCDVQNGERDIEDCDAEWGDGLIDENPLFVDSDNGDYHLTTDSPCIDAGDPDSPRDADSSRADIGAFIFLHSGTIVGHVYDSNNDQPVAGANIRTSTGLSTLTNEEGFYNLSPVVTDLEFDLTASLEWFVDSTLQELFIEDDDTLTFDFNLLGPRFSAEPEMIDELLYVDSTLQHDLTISNEGNYRLSWNAIKTNADDLEPLDLVQSIEVGAIVEDNRIEGVVFANDNFYVSGGGNEQNRIYIFNRNGQLTGSFDQPGNTQYGLYDLTWDGELIWGGNNDHEIYAITTEGEVIHSWEGPERANQAIAWDSDREVLWISGITSNDFTGYNRNGQVIETLTQFNLWIYGIAYLADDLDGYQLYALSFRIPNSNEAFIYKIDIENADTLYVGQLDVEDVGSPRGCFISQDFERFQTNFIAILNGGNEEIDLLNVWYLGQDAIDWLDLVPTEGITEPHSEVALQIEFSAVDLEPDNYEALIKFEFPEVHAEASIPVSLEVEPVSVQDESELPFEFAIQSIHPNPFNSSTTLTYTVPRSQLVSLRFFDLQGREVNILHEGLTKQGMHSQTINGADFSTGIYFVSLESPAARQIRKLAVIK